MPLYSEEIQDIMGRIPGRILKTGLSTIFILILLLLTGSYYFKYPETVSCPLTLTTLYPPQELYARNTGKIALLARQEQDSVTPGCLIAILQNAACYEDTRILEQSLKQLERSTNLDSVVLHLQLQENLTLGELQAGYLQLCKVWNNFRNYKLQGYLPLKISLQTRQIQKARAAFKELTYRQKLQNEDFALEQKRYLRDSAFYYRFPDAVSMVDFEKQIQSYLQKKSSYLTFCSTVNEAENNILKQEEQLIDLKIQYEQELHSYRQDIQEAYKLLWTNYLQWQEKYLLISNIEGILTFTGHWSENQTINAGELLATVIPSKATQIIGRASIDMQGIGKVKAGQTVNIKLNGFPYMEFGMLKGTVKHISLVPDKDKGYIAEIYLNDGMLSTYQKQLHFIQRIEGTAEIITADRRLLSRLIEPLKSKLKE